MKSSEIITQIIRVIDIGYVTTLYFTMAFFISLSIDRMLGKFNTKDADKKTTFRLVVEVIAQFWCIGVIAYFIKLFVIYIPFPLNGIYGYNHETLEQLHSPAMFFVVMVLFQKYLYNTLQYLYQRMNP